MEMAPAQPEHRGILLLLPDRHNLPSSYWAPVIKTLNARRLPRGGAGPDRLWQILQTRQATCTSIPWRATPSRCSIICRSPRPTSSRIRWAAWFAVRIARAYPDRIRHLVLAAPIGLEDYRLYVPPTPTEKILEHEDKLTADGYRKQLETNYSLKLPPDQVTPFIDARFNIKGSSEYPRWLRAFVSSAQMIYREPVVHEIPLITQPTLFIMGADDHNAPGRANAPEALRPKMGQNAELAKALAAKMARCARRGDPRCRASGVSGKTGSVQQADARLPGQIAFRPESVLWARQSLPCGLLHVGPSALRTRCIALGSSPGPQAGRSTQDSN